MQGFENLPCWQSARELVNAVYLLTKKQCFSKDTELSQLLRSASLGVLSGIMEGFEQSSPFEFIQCLYAARGSSAKVVALLYVALDQHYITQKDFKKLRQLVETTIRQITSLIHHLKSSRLKSSEINA